ncbi:MAG: antibiotic biosynthesis monooxygenase [Dehalococcoidia bacterium]|nr:antibiotic biosynthesis monooxygenase [Dehalococcoidia bacterium]
MFVARFDETMIPGRRLAIEDGHRQAGAILARHPGFRRARLLHFAGGPYHYVYEIDWRDRDAWDAFVASSDFPAVRALIDRDLSEPAVVSLYDCKALTDGEA